MTDITLREKCPNTEFFLVRLQKNTEQEKLRIWTLFKQCYIYIALCLKIAAHLLFSGRAYENKVILSLNKKNEKWKIWNFLKANTFISLIFRSSTSQVLERILIVHIFSNFQENLSCKVYYHLACFWPPATGCVWRF